LSQAVGQIHDCPGARCAFWERGGAVVEAGCAVQRLGLDLSNSDLVRYLLELRQALEEAGSDEEEGIARRGLDALVSPDLSGSE
jgi:hypothetical protein